MEDLAEHLYDEVLKVAEKDNKDPCAVWQELLRATSTMLGKTAKVEFNVERKQVN